MENIITTVLTENLTLASILWVILSSTILGTIISGVYIFTHKKEGYSREFSISLIMLPIIISMIILLVGSNVARAFSLAGAFSLIRFRSAPGDAQDIANVFFSVAVGLACGMGQIAFATILTIILCAIIIILKKINFGTDNTKRMNLKIMIPEDMDYYGLFDETLNSYLNYFKLTQVKTKEYGSLYELNYKIILKENINVKEFIDNLRILNGNLNISVSSIVNELN